MPFFLTIAELMLAGASSRSGRLLETAQNPKCHEQLDQIRIQARSINYKRSLREKSAGAPPIEWIDTLIDGELECAFLGPIAVPLSSWWY